MFVGLRLLIIEEASTCAQSLFGSIDSCLQQLKDRPGSFAGGVHIFFYGNWLQLGPLLVPHCLLNLHQMLPPNLGMATISTRRLTNWFFLTKIMCQKTTRNLLLY
jgi:hypothetical protein